MTDQASAQVLNSTLVRALSDALVGFQKELEIATAKREEDIQEVMRTKRKWFGLGRFYRYYEANSYLCSKYRYSGWEAQNKQYDMRRYVLRVEHLQRIITPHLTNIRLTEGDLNMLKDYLK